MLLLGGECLIAATLCTVITDPYTISPEISLLSLTITPALLFDRLSLTMFGFVSFIGLGVYRFSVRYLNGEPTQPRLMFGLGAAISSAQLFALSGDLASLAVAWITVSLSLTVLLEHYNDRPRALLASRKKFIFSRCGDISMLAVIALLWSNFYTLDFGALFRLAQHSTDPQTIQIFEYAALGLLFAVLCKSAQVPFHSWLPDTLETPTPVSALMHAGIINSGGYALVRLSPIFANTEVAPNFAILFGALTAVFGTVVMWTQTSIKKSLAWSTVSQMGFMIMQCGLGAYTLAILHIFGHGLYKANAFLRSGTIAYAIPTRTIGSTVKPLTVNRTAFGLIAAAMAVVITGWYAANTDRNWLVEIVPLVVLVLSATQILITQTGNNDASILLRILLVAALFLLVVTLKSTLDFFFAGTTVAFTSTYERSLIGAFFVAGAAAMMTILSLIDRFIAGSKNQELKETFLTHAINGFYIGLIIDRLIIRFWPKKKLDYVR